MPNAIILAYHGASTDPFQYFPGNSVRSSLGLNSYPTGVIDRISGVQSRSVWLNLMNQRNTVPATVQIECTSRSYDQNTRTFNATFDLTALQTLSGQYNYNVIITEDGIIWPQNGTLGGPNYVHDWTVRSMVNGAMGELVINGTWNQGQTITKSITNYVLPVPTGGGPDIVPDSCQLVCLVYKTGTPLNSNAAIQQAEQWSLFSPDYIATMTTNKRDHIGQTNTAVQFNATLRNMGLLQDTYYVGLSFEGPGGWTRTFTTVNGTHQIGEIDSLDLIPGDTTAISVTIDPNSIAGFGKPKLEFWSKNSVSTSGYTEFRLATFGIDLLVIDDEADTYEDYFTTALDNLGETYGIVSSSAVPPATGDLHTIKSLIWLTGLSEPGLNSDELNALGFYLDFGGNLFLNGVDIAYQLADPQSPYYTQNTLAFFNNYLHASYVQRNFYTLSVDGVDGDPISDGISQMKLFGGTGANNLGANSGKYPNEIAAGDSSATEIFTYWYSPGNIAGIRANHYDGKVIFTTFGFESIAEDSNRTKLAQRIVDWFASTTSVDGQNYPQLVRHLELNQNYPNPFNPETKIKYALPTKDNGERATLVVYNQLGQKVRTLVNEIKPSGRYEISWNGQDDSGKSVASGVYFYQLTYGSHQSVKKMVLLR